jgi:hypothetical protein
LAPVGRYEQRQAERLVERAATTLQRAERGRATRARLCDGAARELAALLREAGLAGRFGWLMEQGVRSVAILDQLSAEGLRHLGLGHAEVRRLRKARLLRGPDWSLLHAELEQATEAEARAAQQEQSAAARKLALGAGAVAAAVRGDPTCCRCGPGDGAGRAARACLPTCPPVVCL